MAYTPPIIKKARRTAKVAVLWTLSHTGLLYLLRPWTLGCGVILALHSVAEPGAPILDPFMTMPVDFLDRLLSYVRSLGWDIVSIDEARRRLVEGDRAKRFACFTFDDGYADTLTAALPVFKRHQAPLCVYITTGFPNRTLVCWWGGLERLVLDNTSIEVPGADGHIEVLAAHTMEEKLVVYGYLSARTHRDPSFLSLLNSVFARYGVNAVEEGERLGLDWVQAKELARNPLVTIGAHTRNHLRLAQLGSDELRREMEESRAELEQRLNVQVRHFAYPFGYKGACGPREFHLAREVGFHTAVTTRRGNLFPAHRDHLTCLPRQSVLPPSSDRLRNLFFGVDALLRRRRPFITD